MHTTHATLYNNHEHVCMECRDVRVRMCVTKITENGSLTFEKMLERTQQFESLAIFTIRIPCALREETVNPFLLEYYIFN